MPAFLAALGLARGDRLLVMLPNGVPLWETMLAAIRLGAVMIPATTLLESADLRDRLERGRVKAVITEAALECAFRGPCRGRRCASRSAARSPGWIPFAQSLDAGGDFPGGAHARR